MSDHGVPTSRKVNVQVWTQVALTSRAYGVCLDELIKLGRVKEVDGVYVLVDKEKT